MATTNRTDPASMQAIQGYLAALKNPRLMTKAIRVALVIGTLLLLINHGAAIRAGTMTRDRWFSAGLTYLIPYLVSIHGQYMAMGDQKSG